MVGLIASRVCRKKFSAGDGSRFGLCRVLLANVRWRAFHAIAWHNCGQVIWAEREGPCPSGEDSRQPLQCRRWKYSDIVILAASTFPGHGGLHFPERR